MVKSRIQKLYSMRRLLLDMAVRQLKAKYAGSKLGIWWAVVTPLLLAGSITVVFKGAYKIDMPHYTFFVLAGILPWFFFSNALLESANSFQTHISVLKQSAVPREYIPAGSVLANLFNFLLGLMCLLPFFALLHPARIWLFLCLIPVILFQFIFVLGLGIMLSVLRVFSRDVEPFLNIFFMIWFWLTPVFYPMDMVPFPFRWMIILNPVTYFTLLYQRVLFEGGLPSFFNCMISLLAACVFFLGGYFFFLKKEGELMKRI